MQDPSADTETEDISEDMSNNNQNGNTNAALPQTATGSNSNSTDSKGGHQTDSTSVFEGDKELRIRMPKMVNLQESGLQRSPRLNARKALTTLLTAFLYYCIVPQSVQSAIGFTTDAISEINRAAHRVEMNFNSTLIHLTHYAFAAGKENNEVYTFREMLKQDDRDDFIMQCKSRS